MEKVPAAGYEIVGLPIEGMSRKKNMEGLLHNLKLPFKIFKCLRKANRILKDFRPDAVVGVGGYASGPLLFQASLRGIPYMIQEQNSYAGVTNRILARRAKSICVAYEGMDRFFPAGRIIVTGNPVRPEIHPYADNFRIDALRYFNFDTQKLHLLVLGGSLGSGTLNKAMRGWIEAGCPGGKDVEVLWQCGKYYKADNDTFMESRSTPEKIIHTDFIARMDHAYAAADLIISRSGASSISEICVAGKATIFVPSPNVSEDHQTHNAMALVKQGAALMVSDAEAPEKLLPTAMELIHDAERMKRIAANAAGLARPAATKLICSEVYRIRHLK